MKVVSDLILRAIEQEGERAYIKHGDKNFMGAPRSDMTDGERLAILVEEVGEVAKELCETRYDMQSRAMEPGGPAFREMDSHYKNLHAELIQVATMAACWAQSIDLYGAGPQPWNR